MNRTLSFFLICLLSTSITKSQTLYEFSITSNDIDFIFETDPDTFTSLTYIGQQTKEMPNKLSSGLIENNVYVFEATFSNGKKVGIWCGSAFGSVSAAREYVDKLTPRLGKLPEVHRDELDHVNIHVGDASANAERQGHFFNLYSINMDKRISTNDLEETVFHESVHAGIQDDFGFTTAWQNAQANDAVFVTDYGQEFPDREDMAEAALFAYTVIVTPGRLDSDIENWVKTNNANRLAFFRDVIGYAPSSGGGSGSQIAVSGVSLNQSSISINEGQTFQLTETVSPSNASNKDVSWSSANTSVATVNSSGIVTAVASGSTNITVSTDDGSFTANCSVTVLDSSGSTTDEEFGILEEKFTVTTTANRRAMPIVVPQSGTVTHLSMRHVGGSGSMVLAIYEGAGSSPTNRIGTTATTAVSSSDGWQEIALETPVTVSAGQNVFLAWVYENNPGIYYDEGQPGRVDADAAWSEGMPSSWGSVANQSNWVYNIKAKYGSDTTISEEFGILEEKFTVTTTANRRAMPIVVPQSGTVTHLSMRHVGGSGSMILAIYEGAGSSPTNRIGTTATTAVSSSDGWQEIALETTVTVSAGQNVFLAWVYENNPGIYYDAGQPGRVDADAAWSEAMPSSWGSIANQSNWVYNIKARYSLDGNLQQKTKINTDAHKQNQSEELSKSGSEEFMTLYPNPVSESLNVLLAKVEKNTVINIFDVLGSLKISIKPEQKLQKIDLTKLKTGVYFISVKGQKTKKIVKL